MYLCGLMRIRIAGWLLDSTVIENWLSLIRFFPRIFDKIVLHSFFFSFRSLPSIHNYYETDDKVRCRFESNRIGYIYHHHHHIRLALHHGPRLFLLDRNFNFPFTLGSKFDHRTMAARNEDWHFKIDSISFPIKMKLINNYSLACLLESVDEFHGNVNWANIWMFLVETPKVFASLYWIK